VAHVQSRVIGLTIRPFKAEDLPHVMQLIQDQFGEVFRPDLYTSIADAWPDAFLVVDTGPGIGGALVAIHDGPLSGRVLMMVVEPALRGRGVGTRLMDTFTRRCLERGFRSITLEVRAGNYEAQRFYRRHKFRPVGVLARYYNDGQDGIKMERTL
jgi:ribosomal protein S18 acetylase RimI-like enzyme